MFNKLEHIESLIADYEARIKINKALIKQYKKSLKKKKIYTKFTLKTTSFWSPISPSLRDLSNRTRKR